MADPQVLNYRFRVRRGATAAVAAEVALPGEFLLNTDTNKVTMGDGATAGGLVLHKASVGLGNVVNAAQLEASQLETDPLLASDSDAKVPSSKAVRAYVAAHAGGGGGGEPFPVDKAGLEHWWVLPWARSVHTDAVSLPAPTQGTVTLAPGCYPGRWAASFVSAYQALSSRSSTQIGSGSFSTAFWFRPSTVGNSEGYMFCKYDAQTSGEWLLWLAGAYLRFACRAADNTTRFDATSSVAVAANTWHHGVAVVDRSASTLRLYQDGALVATTAFASLLSAGSAPLSFGTLTLNGAPYGIQYSGALQDVSIWHRVLTADEIAILAQVNGVPFS